MNKIALLTFANIRKTKGHTVTLLILFFIAALLLNVGLLIQFNFRNYIDKTVEELNTTNMYYTIPNSLYKEEVKEYLANHDNVQEVQLEEAICTEVKFDKDKRSIFLMKNADIYRSLSRWKFVGKHLPVDEMSVYLPYIFQLNGGYQLDDTFEISFEDNITMSFKIKGFIEDVLFSSPETGRIGIYFPQNTYEYVSNTLGTGNQVMVVCANLKEITKDVEIGIKEIIRNEISSRVMKSSEDIFSLDLPLIVLSRTMMASMVATTMVAFSTIIVIVCLLVVRFRIGNSIEEDMMKIGSLKAIGYTNRLIRLSVAFQFTLIAFVGSMIGIAVSYLTIPALADIFAQQSGLFWEQGFDAKISSTALLFIIAIVGIVAIISTGKIGRLHPITALRGGITTHSFRKNYFPLDKTKGNLPAILSLKSICQNKKQNLMITFIIIAVSFAQTFAVIMFYNTLIDTRTFLETPGVELSNVGLIFKPEVEKDKIFQEIKDRETVRKVQYIDEVSLKIEQNEVTVYVMEDYTKKETDMVYQGRYPIHSNEIVLSGHLADMIDKAIGDSVLVTFGDKEERFVVTGLSQGAFMGGMNSSITYGGMIQLDEKFEQQILHVYLNKGENASEFLNDMGLLYKNSFYDMVNLDKEMEEGAGVYISIISKIGIVILIVTMAVVLLVLYFVINSTVIRKKRELGIQKAIGYTTIQLMNQISLSFLLPIIVGVFIGTLLGMTQTNVIMSIGQRAMGIMKANYIITPGYITLFGVAMVVISYLTSMIITYRIRKISAYALVSE